MNTAICILNVKDYTALDIALTSGEGEIIHRLILDAFRKGFNVIVDFEGIRAINTAFLNTAIGKLYSKYDSPYLNRHLSIHNISDSDLRYLKKAIETAIEYYKNPVNFKNSVKKAFHNG